MTMIYIFGAIVVVGFIVISLFGVAPTENKKEKVKYQYTRKNYFFTRAENEFYKTLERAVGNDYYIFAQVHLSTIVDHKINGQSWKGALSHINRKSVDYVLCDKSYVSPKLAIELDDKTHERSDRVERDAEVERILSDAGLPLLRIQNHGSFNETELKQQIQSFLSTANVSGNKIAV